MTSQPGIRILARELLRREAGRTSWATSWVTSWMTSWMTSWVTSWMTSWGDIMGTGLRTLCACASALLLTRGSAAAASVTHAPPSGGDLFGTKVVTLAVQISPTDLEILEHNTDSHSYVPCTVSVGGDTLTNVGVHCRGNPARELASGKP